MQKTEKKLFDEDGNLMIRPYRLKDLAAIYDVSTKTIRRWIDSKASEYSKRSKQYFTIEQVKGIVTALGIPHKVSPVVHMQPFKQAV